uniref:Uncharacterized protein n=1 Tax=Ciona intestinalis TaxID=7719 RepID=H2XRZ1_CIOIN
MVRSVSFRIQFSSVRRYVLIQRPKRKAILKFRLF